MAQNGEKLRIVCPHCQAAYKLPKSKIGSKPRKLLCAKCEKAFTVARRNSIPPAGLKQFQYEEFEREESQLPAEFGFLTEVPRIADTSPQTVPEPRPVQPPKPAPPAQQAVPPVKAPAKAPAPRPEPSVHVASEKHFDESDTSWIRQEPLDMNEFSISDETESSRKAGKIASAVIAFIVVFFIFVAFRNGWTLSLPDLGSEIAFAFSTKTLEKFPEAVKDLETTLSSRRALVAEDGRALLIVTGEVYNRSTLSKKNVVIRGRLTDARGDLRAEVKRSCGREIDDIALQKSTPAELDTELKRRISQDGCRISAEGSGAYQLVFDPAPRDYDSSFELEIRVVEAE